MRATKYNCENCDGSFNYERVTMNDIYAGKLCGVCHNGERAFDAQGNCTRCHVKQ